MAYTQNPGRGPMMKTGRGPAIASLTDDDKKKPKMVTVKATGDGEEWNIDVAEGSNMHKQSMELGTVPVEFRQINVNIIFLFIFSFIFFRLASTFFCINSIVYFLR